MSDSKPQQSPPAIATGVTTVPSPVAGQVDPFESLFKMSTTAGLGSAEYVAINGTSIAALLLGIASSLVLFQSMILLIIPVIGVICAVLAFRQIANSNGTQAGRGLAALGLLLSLGLGGYYVTRQGMAAIQERIDNAQLGSMISQFGSDIGKANYDDAYGMCDSRFTSRVPLPIFSERLKIMNNNPVLGPVKAMESNNLLKYDVDPVTGDRTCSGMAVITFGNVQGQDRVGMVFRNLDGKWRIDDLPNMFPQEQAKQGPAGRSAPTPPITGPAGPPVPKQ
jgi:hypothetical protein